MCQLLNTIDQSGFFEFDTFVYDNQTSQVFTYDGFFEEGPVNEMTIRSWKARYIHWDDWRHAADYGIDVPAPLQIVHGLVDHYQMPDTARYYQAKEEVLLMFPYDPARRQPTATPWPTTLPSLQKLYHFAKFSYYDSLAIIIDPTMAAQIEYYADYTENGPSYKMVMRGLLPYESLEAVSSYDYIPPSRGVPQDLRAITCYPADGLVSVPASWVVKPSATITPVPPTPTNESITITPSNTPTPIFTDTLPPWRLLYAMGTLGGHYDYWSLNMLGQDPQFLYSCTPDSPCPRHGSQPSPDGQWFTQSLTDDQYQWHWFIRSLTRTHTLSFTLEPTYRYPDLTTWSPDSRYVAISKGDNVWNMAEHTIYVIDLQTEHIRHVITGANEMAWSPTENKLLVFLNPWPSDHDRAAGFYLFDMATGEKQRLLLTEQPWSYGGSWSPDGQQVALSIETGAERHLVIVSTETQQATPVISAPVLYPRWSPRGDYILYEADKQLYLFHVTTQETRLLVKYDIYTSYRDLNVWSPDGQYVLYDNFWIASVDEEKRYNLDPVCPQHCQEITRIAADGWLKTINHRYWW